MTPLHTSRVRLHPRNYRWLMPSSGRLPRIGLNGLMQWGEIWSAAPDGDRMIAKLTPGRLEEACQTLKAATGC